MGTRMTQAATHAAGLAKQMAEKPKTLTKQKATTERATISNNPAPMAHDTESQSLRRVAQYQKDAEKWKENAVK